jgi:hypothetical protein
MLVVRGEEGVVELVVVLIVELTPIAEEVLVEPKDVEAGGVADVVVKGVARIEEKLDSVVEERTEEVVDDVKEEDAVVVFENVMDGMEVVLRMTDTVELEAIELLMEELEPGI